MLMTQLYVQAELAEVEWMYMSMKSWLTNSTVETNYNQHVSQGMSQSGSFEDSITTESQSKRIVHSVMEYDSLCLLLIW